MAYETRPIAANSTPIKPSQKKGFLSSGITVIVFASASLQQPQRSMQPNDADNGNQPLSHYVSATLERYFDSLNGSAPPCDLYRLVLEQVEKPLLEHVLEYSRGNQSLAAEVLGINRGTLRKKLRTYSIDY